MRCQDQNQTALQAANRQLFELEQGARAINEDTAPVAVTIASFFVMGAVALAFLVLLFTF